MAPLAQETVKYSEQEEKLFRELDKGIDDMEQGNTIPSVLFSYTNNTCKQLLKQT